MRVTLFVFSFWQSGRGVCINEKLMQLYTLDQNVSGLTCKSRSLEAKLAYIRLEPATGNQTNVTKKGGVRCLSSCYDVFARLPSLQRDCCARLHGRGSKRRDRECVR